MEKVGGRLENTTGVYVDIIDRITAATVLYYAHLESTTPNDYSILLIRQQTVLLYAI